MTEKRWFSPKEVVERYGVKPWAIKKARASGDLKVIKVGRTVLVDEEELAAWFKKHEMKGGKDDGTSAAANTN